MIKIVNLKQLKEWNNNPTKEKPIVMEWFLDWIIDECPKKYADFKDAYDTYVRFTIFCENKSLTEAVELTNSNLKYWYKRASKNSKRFKNHFNKTLVYYHGF